MGNKNNIDSLSNYNISSTGKNYLRAVKKGMKILSNKMENNTNNIYKAIEKKYFDRIINIRKIQPISDENKITKINWKNYIIHYFYSRINEEEYFSNIIDDIQNESFLSENKYVSSAFFKEFILLTEPENLENIDKNLDCDDDEEIDKDEILLNNLKSITINGNMREINFSTSKINLTNITVNLGGSFNANDETSMNDEIAFQYNIIRNRIKAIMKIWKRHLKNHDHPIRIIISIYEKHFTNSIIEKKKKLNRNEIKTFNDTIIEEIHKFILKCQSTLKLMYSQSFDLLCFSEEKDETIGLVTNCLFETGNLYDEIYSLYKIELENSIKDYSNKLKVLQNITPQNLNIPDKFCLNNLTEECQKKLKNNKNKFILTGINNNDKEKKNENLNEIDTNKKITMKEEKEIKKEGYNSAINLLKGLKYNKTPFEKMMLIASISTEITKCINNYWKGMEYYINPTLLKISADELMPIFIFIVIKSQMPELLIHTKIIFDFTTKNIKQSTIGYYNITLEGSVEYILNSAIQELGFEEELKHIIEDNKSVNNLPFSIEN